MPESWVRELREIHDSNFGGDWGEHVGALNRRLGLSGPDELALPAPTLAPVWFAGNVEALPAREWVLVVSLNQRRQRGDEPWHEAQRYTAESYWEHWRWLNRDYWHPRFYRRLVRLAAAGLGVDVQQDHESDFATNRMAFIELCPYSSEQFRIGGERLRELAEEDLGFRVAARVRQLLIEEAHPAVVLFNGMSAIEDFEVLHAPDVDWDEQRYPSVAQPEKSLWHKQGFYAGTGEPVPVVGFPFLGKPRTHNGYDEIYQLGGMVRSFIGR